jgi:DNA-binding response OmpR family regulator
VERKPRILIIEDDEYSAEAYAHLLDASGFEAAWAEDGSTGFEKARQMRPDAILLDLSLPGIDGYKLIELIRADSDLKSARILVITGRDRTEAQSAIDLGADSCLIKPVDLNDMLRELSSLNIAATET